MLPEDDNSWGTPEEYRCFPSILRELFPGHPGRHIRFAGYSPEGKKKTVTERYPAYEKEYAAHLSADSFDGPGALGLMPGFLDRSKLDGKARWNVSWVKMEFDAIGLGEVSPLVEHLRTREIYCYLDQGTTGRGVHLSIFFSEPVPQPKAARVLKEISRIARSLDLPAPCKMVPSNQYNVGTGMFLPYRAAAEDGYGFNPLIDPTTGESIPLLKFREMIMRTSPDRFTALAPDKVPEEGHRKNTTPKRRYRRVADPEGSWDAELRRLDDHWEEGVRQNLTLGATAYGLRLEIASERVEEDLQRVAEENNDEEVNDRVKAINNTITTYEKGELVAWREYYDAAGLEPPRLGLVVTEEVTEKVHAAEAKGRRDSWRGKGEISARSVYCALSRRAYQHGMVHPSGVEVSISVRDLALEAGLGKKATTKAIERLIDKRLVLRGRSHIGSRSGTLIIAVNDTDLLEIPLTQEKGTALFSDPDLRLRWGAGRLGKLAEAILEALHHLGRAKRGEIARYISPERKSESLKKPLQKLRCTKLVDQDKNGSYFLAPGFYPILREVLTNDSSIQAQSKDRARYSREREAFNKYFLDNRIN